MKKILPLKSAFGYALIFMMIGASVIFNDKEIILPEMAALAIGCLIHQNSAWLAKPLHIFLLPSITAIGGFVINRLDVNLPAKLILAVMFVLLTLRVFRSGLAPALATGLLPVITNATSVYFIFSILTLTFILAISLYAKREALPAPMVSKRQRPQDNILYIIFVSAWVLICAQNGWMYIAAIPPVLVVGYESMHKEEYTFKMFYKQVICLSLAAYIGIQSLYFLNNLLLAALLDLVAVTLMLRLVSFKLTPAYAMSLLPMVLHHPSHQYFYWNVFVMAAIVLGTIYSYKNFRLREQLRVRLARVSDKGEEV
ncbi:hypothetical protein [Mucilaginibacter rubeus]|uniref:HPP family protein n=1 Tax=Mucilaginibacter rubeus TaxID=2027860 RepID=A0A5C1HUR5_9SPHI|nr:hypothetical protein [Mucilaginibacter rubeus]QEM09319.1 hypothetical protein DEO27_004585 [Mucilaginibacter rubeus]